MSLKKTFEIGRNEFLKNDSLSLLQYKNYYKRNVTFSISRQELAKRNRITSLYFSPLLANLGLNVYIVHGGFIYHYFLVDKVTHH